MQARNHLETIGAYLVKPIQENVDCFVETVNSDYYESYISNYQQNWNAEVDLPIGTRGSYLWRDPLSISRPKIQ